MINGNRFALWIAVSLLSLFSACSSSSDGGLSVVSVVQDLNADPDGLTTRVLFSESPGGVAASSFNASAGQIAQTATRQGNSVWVTWDTRVTRQHSVTVGALPGLNSQTVSVGTTDASRPTFTITSAVQHTGDNNLGGDTLAVAFTGPRVVPAEVSDPLNWDLSIDGTSLDLTGSVFNFDPGTQTLLVTLGSGANLHASFDLAATGISSVAGVNLDTAAIAGVATGDTTVPTVVSVEQVLAQDALGRVVDFTFDKPMDPALGLSTAGFTVNDHPDSTGVTLVLGVQQPSDTVLRVTFSASVVPGLDTVTLNNVPGYHGNEVSGTEAVVNSSPAVNAYTTVDAVTVENGGGDHIVVVTDQAFDPDLAIDPARWSLTVDGSGVTMADQTLTYDAGARELTIDLDFDMKNGDAVVITAISPVDVDGQTFTGAPGFAVNAAGDATAPTLVSVRQNRAADPSGQTIDLTFSEYLDATSVMNTAFYSTSPGSTINTASLVGGSGNTVRVETDTAIIPGDYMVSVVGALSDLAGNAFDVPGGTPASVSTTDIRPPTPISFTAAAIEGADDDRIVVSFDDSMIQSEVEDPMNWNLESPLGNTIDLTGSTISYSNQVATLTLDGGGLALKVDDDAEVTLMAMRDLGGNSVGSSPLSATVTGETRLPTTTMAWLDGVSANEVVVRFSEPCDELTDLYESIGNPTGSRFAIRDDDVAQTLRGYPTTATVLDGGLGVRLSYGFLVDIDDTLDVLGLTDLAGNVMFPALDLDIVAEDTTVPGHTAPGNVEALEGERNDVVRVDFNTAMSPWKLLDLSQYTVIENGGGAIDLSNATIEQLSPSQVLLRLENSSGADIQYNVDYDVQLEVDPSNPLRSEQGVPITVADLTTITAVGDQREPLQLGSSIVLNQLDLTGQSAYVVFNEAVGAGTVAAPGNFVYDSGTGTGQTATIMGPRSVLVDFDAVLTAGNTIEISGAVDLAGNVSPGTITLAVVDDQTPPVLASVTAEATENVGNDTIEVAFNEIVDLTSALDRDNYTVTNGGPVDLALASLSWDSVAGAVTIKLPSRIDLDVNQGVTVQVSGVSDVAGNSMPSPASLGTTVGGDLVAPDLDSAFVNLREDASGAVVDVLFDEDVDTTFAGTAGNWSSSGGQVVSSVEAISERHYRLTLQTPLGAADSLMMTGVSDVAGNPAGALAIDPEE